MYDKKKADNWVEFFQTLLTHTKDIYARKPFMLRSWQERIVRDLFGTVKSNGRRQYRMAYVEIGKKNGKSEMGAGFGLGGLLLDDYAGAEVYIAASSRDQASLIFKVAAQMVRNNEELSSELRIIDSTKTIYRKDGDGFLRAISADAGTNDGLNPSMVIFDELHRQPNRDLWDVLYYGTATRSQPLFISLTTAGVIGESDLCWDQHEYARAILEGQFQDPEYYPVIYALDKDEAWDIEGLPELRDKRGNVKRPATGWYKANPGLGDYLNLDALRSECEKAKRIPSEQNSFRRFRLSQWVQQESRWIMLDDWNKCGAPFNASDFIGRPCYCGLDLSTSIDISAFVKVFPLDGLLYLVPEFWVPQAEVEKRSSRGDKRFEMWAAQRLINVCPGNQIDYRQVRAAIEQQSSLYDFRELAFDPWNATEMTQNLIDFGLNLVPVRQGFQSISPPSKEFERLILAERIRHGGNPVLTWMIDCASLKSDPAGNIKPVKPDRLKSMKRIDGVMASIMGIDRAIRNGEGVAVERGIVCL